MQTQKSPSVASERSPASLDSPTRTALLTDSPNAASGRGLAFPLIGLIVLQFAAMMLAVFVLGGAINWPQSLGDPPRALLPAVYAQAGAVKVGYLGYFFSALLLVPIALGLGVLWGQGRTISVLGALAGVLKLFGISRWLTTMPFLAQAWQNQPADRAAVALVFEVVNRYAGGIGENLGVLLFGALWTLGVSWIGLKSGNLGRATAWSGMALGALTLAGIIELAGFELGGAYLSLTGAGWQVWMLALAWNLWKNARRAASSARGGVA